MMTLTQVFPPEDEDDDVYFVRNFVRLLEVYIHNFIQLAQTTNPDKLLHLSRAVLHGIHSVFPPPSVTGHAGEYPVSQKKLEQGDGQWATCKEILGWIFDGTQHSIELPCIGVPAGKGQMGPINAELRGTKHLIQIKGNPQLRDALQDFGTLIHILGTHPTHCRKLIVDDPGYVGYCDASKLGAGGCGLQGRKCCHQWFGEWNGQVTSMTV
jgi:hypothetical protein